LTFDLKVIRDDAEYIVECLQVLLLSRPTISLQIIGGISDGAIDIFACFLRESLKLGRSCGVVSFGNQPLMARLHRNTTIVHLDTHDLEDDATRLFLAPIAVRNKHLVHVNAKLGTSLDDSK
jgi:hypothetical protein